MCGNNWNGCGGNLWWIIILVFLFYCCGNNGICGQGCGCERDNNCCC